VIQRVPTLARVEDTIDADRMRRMNETVDERGERPSAVARRMLEELK